MVLESLLAVIALCVAGAAAGADGTAAVGPPFQIFSSGVAGILEMFGIPVCALARVCDSDAVYGTTTMEGLFSEPVPICGVLGDSHAALFGQGCLKPGMIKATYGTGSSLMMNI